LSAKALDFALLPPHLAALIVDLPLSLILLELLVLHLVADYVAGSSAEGAPYRRARPR